MLLSLWRIGGGSCVGLLVSSTIVVLLRCLIHGSSMALMSNTAKLVGGGWYTAVVVASIRFDDAHPILNSPFLISQFCSDSLSQ